MAAPKGNEFWKLRTKTGRTRLFAEPEALWEAACEYFQWCDEHPWLVVKNRTKGKTKEKEESPTQRPYSITGLVLYLDISLQTWYNIKERNEKEFMEVLSRIERVIETQQFEGACVGAFNANIIARKLGLADKQEVDHTTQGKSFRGFDFLPYTPEADKLKNV